MSFRPASAVALVAGVSLLAAGCSIKKNDSADKNLSGGSIKSDTLKGASLKGASLKVGSKEFDEQLLLGQISVLALKAAGAKVTDKTNIQGTNNARKALTDGDIDMYWDYTGTGWIDFLQNTKPIQNPQQQFEATKKEDLAKNKIVWVDPAPANNTYALAAKQSTLTKFKVKTLSDYAALAKRDPSDATICVESEFKSRDDGFPGVEKKYNFTLPGNDEKLLDTAVVYTTLNKGGDCNFGEVFETDGRVAGLHLKLVQDDKKFFPVYNPAVTMTESIYKKYPKIENVFKPIAAKLDTATLSALNKKVSVDGQKPDKVAHDWLKAQGFIG